MQNEDISQIKGVSGIYSISQIGTNRIYVGKAKNLYTRYKQHLNDLLSDRHHNIFLQRIVNKHGIDSLEFNVLLIYENIDFLSDIEVNTISNYRDDDDKIVINLTDGGEGWNGAKHTEETKLKISKSRKGKYKGKNNPNYGIKLSEERKQSISEFHKGKTISDKQKAKTKSTNLLRYGGSARYKAVWQISKSGEKIRQYKSLTHAANAIGGDKNHISKCCNGKRKYHLGYMWEFVE